MQAPFENILLQKRPDPCVWGNRRRFRFAKGKGTNRKAESLCIFRWEPGAEINCRSTGQRDSGRRDRSVLTGTASKNSENMEQMFDFCKSV